KGPVWYQLYLVGGRDCALSAIERARAAGFSALVVTIDTPVAGLRERDIRNGVKELLSRKLGGMLPFVNQLLTRPRWLVSFLADGGLMKFPNVVISGQGPMLYADVTTALGQRQCAVSLSRRSSRAGRTGLCVRARRCARRGSCAGDRDSA